MTDLLSLEAARRAVLERARPLAAETVPLARAAGRFTAGPARARVDLPPFHSSAMDGYAVRAADVPGRLPVAGASAAGRPAPGPLEPGSAVRIATGAVVPDGADAVVPVEEVVERGSEVEVPAGVAPGASVRPRGGDVRAGEPVVDGGVRVGPGQLGALAAAGVAELTCARRPRVAVLATGTELRPPGRPLGSGEIYEANTPMLAAVLADAGAEVERLGPVADDEAAHREALARGLEADVLVTSGGVSVGPHDLVRRIAGELGVEEVFWRVAVKPGKPLAFGVRGATLVLGLPGNPVSALVGCLLFVRPAVLALQGAADPGPATFPGRLAAPVRRNAARDELVRARVDASGDDVLVVPVRGQESHMIVRGAAAGALVHVERGEGELPAGAVVRWLALP